MNILLSIQLVIHDELSPLYSKLFYFPWEL